MAGRVFKEEDPVAACKAIVNFIARHNHNNQKHDAIRKAILEDLCWKANFINTSMKAALLAQGMYYSLPHRTKQLFTPEFLKLVSLEALPSHTVTHKDVGILTVLKTELDGVVEAFGVGQQRSQDLGAFQYWNCEVERAEGSKLSIVISMVGQPRNVPMAIAVDQMLSLFSVDMVMLVGIAAGPESKTHLGDVVAADRVYDYEHVRSELIGSKQVEKPRPLILDVHKNILIDLGMYNAEWMRNHFATVISTVEQSRLPQTASEINPQFHRGTIAAGERLLADDSLNIMRENKDDRIRAGDQEDSGFAQACEYWEKPWSIFRGIADHGNSSKNDNWHFTASIAAASAAITFLRHSYRPASNFTF